MKENAINNSFQILEEFKCNELKKSLYKPCQKSMKCLRYKKVKQTKIYKEEEIFLHKLKTFKLV